MERPVRNEPPSTRSAFSRARRLRSFRSLLESAPWFSTQGNSFARPALVSLRDTHVEGASVLLELARPPRSCSDRSASRGEPRRVRPTDATHIVKDEHPCKSDRRLVSGRTGSATEPCASMAPSPLPPAHPAPAPSVIDSSRRDRRWCLASRHRPGERRARTRSPRSGRPRPLPPPQH
jgi:hypothetical protein